VYALRFKILEEQRWRGYYFSDTIAFPKHRWHWPSLNIVVYVAILLADIIRAATEGNLAYRQTKPGNGNTQHRSTRKTQLVREPARWISSWNPDRKAGIGDFTSRYSEYRWSVVTDVFEKSNLNFSGKSSYHSISRFTTLWLEAEIRLRTQLCTNCLA